MLVIIVSACLAGCRTRYDGGSLPNDEIMRMVANGEALAVCPEQLGGLAIPRLRSEIGGNGDGRAVLDAAAPVIDEQGHDVTREFIRGAHEILRLARIFWIEEAILKDKSPSCGTRRIYKRGVLVPGMGVTATLLERNGIRVSRPACEQD